MKEKLNIIRVLHFALMAGPSLFSIIVAFVVLTKETTNGGIEVLNYLSPAYFFIMLAIYPIAFRSALKPIKDETVSLDKKLVTFQSAHIIRLALLEGAALFAAVSALINAELYHLISVALVLAIMFTKIPTPHLLENELQLTPEERDQLTSL